MFLEIEVHNCINQDCLFFGLLMNYKIDFINYVCYFLRLIFWINVLTCTIHVPLFLSFFPKCFPFSKNVRLKAPLCDINIIPEFLKGSIKEQGTHFIRSTKSKFPPYNSSA